MHLEELYELRAKIIRSSDFGAMANGSRMDFHMEGEVKGRINGKWSGIDYGRIRKTMGNAVILHVHETIETDRGIVSVLRRGYAIPQRDGKYKVRAFCVFETGSKELEFLNTVVAAVEGTAGDGELNLKVYEIR